MDSLQEKFQLTIPETPSAKEEGEHRWADFKSARSTGEAGFQHVDNASSTGTAFEKLNYLPPGMDISNQKRKRINNMPLSMAGATDVSADVNDKYFEEGFQCYDLAGTDDQYSGEHMDLFYGEATDPDTGRTGFVERNNYLDRS